MPTDAWFGSTMSPHDAGLADATPVPERDPVTTALEDDVASQLPLGMRSSGRRLAVLVREATKRGDVTPFAGPALAVLFLGGGVLTLLLVALPGPAPPPASLIVGVVSSAVGATIWWRRAQPSQAALNALMALATLLIATMTATSVQQDRPDALAFMWIALFCGVFFTLRAQLAHLALITVSYAVATVFRYDDSHTGWIMARHVLIVAGAVGIGMIWLGLLRRLIQALIDQQTRFGRTDSLTGLPNRSELRRRGREALARPGVTASAILIDLDDFKLINDRWGHDRGDRVLRLLAGRLEQAFDHDHLVTRLGADEFAVFQTGAGDPEVTARRIIEVLGAPVRIDDELVRIGASAGLAVARRQEDIDELISDASLALRFAKASEDPLCRFEPAMRAVAHERRQLIDDLRAALDAEQFTLRYQPIVRMRAGRTAAAEALVRWEHPDGRVVGPDAFIPVAEATGLIVPLGRLVLRSACRSAVTWPGTRPPRVTVNLSPRQLLDGHLLGDVRSILDETGLPVQRLVLEITETSVMTEPDLAIRRLHELADLGIHLAIDDFGTGYSSLEYLRKLPVRTIKLARAFVCDLTASPDDAAFASGIIELAHALGKLVVAEGIEDEQQRRILLDLGCDLAQGFLFDRPMLEADLRARLEAEQRISEVGSRAPDAPLPIAPA